MKKKIGILLLCLITGLGGCGVTGEPDQKIKTLDAEKVDSETTDINDRAAYYEKYVDDPRQDMDKKECYKYYVMLHMVYKHAEAYAGDIIIFLRNDNVCLGSMDVGEPDIGLMPGIFRVIFCFGDACEEIQILEPGKEYTLTIDFEKKTAKLSDYHKDDKG